MKVVRQSQSNRAPLDELVKSQLQAILTCEEQLKHRHRILLEASSLDDPQTWAIDVRNLWLRADRLARVLDALEGNYGPVEQFEQGTPCAA
jgi:hypothetical protein